MDPKEFNVAAFISDEEIDQKDNPPADASDPNAKSRSATDPENKTDTSKGDPDEGDDNGDQGQEDDYSIDDAFKAKAQEAKNPEATNLTEALAAEGKLPNETITEFISRKQKEELAKNQVPQFNEGGFDDNGLKQEDYTALSKIEANLKLPAEELVEKAIRAQYAKELAAGTISEDDLSDHISDIKSDRMKMVEYNRSIQESLESQRSSIAKQAKERISTYSQQKEEIQKSRQKALYVSREIFGEKLKPEVLADTEKFITSGDFKKAMSDPANEAKMALLWKNLDIIEDTFKQPGFAEGMLEGKKNYFLRATNSEIQDGGNRANTVKSSMKKGFDPKAFVTDPE